MITVKNEYDLQARRGQSVEAVVAAWWGEGAVAVLDEGGRTGKVVRDGDVVTTISVYYGAGVTPVSQPAT